MVVESKFIPDTKYQDSAGLCPDCGSPLVEALKHDPPLCQHYNRSAYILFCNNCKKVRPNFTRWGDWEKSCT